MRNTCHDVYLILIFNVHVYIWICIVINEEAVIHIEHSVIDSNIGIGTCTGSEYT